MSQVLIPWAELVCMTREASFRVGRYREHRGCVGGNTE
jgi:hypothetical protein